MKVTWSKIVPKEEGWYWIRYQGKNGQVECPCRVMHFGSGYSVQTARNDSFNSHTRTLNGFDNAKFGPRIEEP